MNSISAETIAILAEEATEGLVRALDRRTRRALGGEPGEAALRRAVHTALLALLAEAQGVARMTGDALVEQFRAFFGEPDSGRALSTLLRSEPLPVEELVDIWNDEHAEGAPPGSEFAGAFRRFEATFRQAAGEEPLLAPRVATKEGAPRSPLPPGAEEEVRRLVELALQHGLANLGIGDIEVGEVHGQNVVVGSQHFHITTSEARDAPAARSLRDAYLRHLFRSLRELALGSVDPGAVERATRLHLDGVYTALLTTTSNGAQLALTGASGRPLSALAQLDRHKWLVLLGDPGGGKSTFVNFVALCLAGEALGEGEANLALLTSPLPDDDERRILGRDEEPTPQPWRHGTLLPVRVILRDFAARGLPAAGQPITAACLWQFIEGEMGAHALADFAPVLKRHLHDEGGLILLDGLDEVPAANERRRQLIEAVRAFEQAFSRCRFLVTSRTYAYQQQAWKLPSFSEAVLAPFTPEQVRQFVARWYHHWAEQSGQNVAMAEGRAQLLQRAIDGSARLRELAERPLLLTLMASLHAWRGGTLPEKREELYHTAVELLLVQWEQQRVVTLADGTKQMQPSLAEFLKVERDKLRRLLNQLAYEAHSSQPEAVGTADLPQERLVTGLVSLSDDPDVKPLRLVEYLEQRAGLLVPRGVEVYTFPHRTFQEYLAACHLADFGYPGEVARLARDEPGRWREVALLAGAKMARGGAWALWPLVGALCHRAPDDPTATEGDEWGALLAGQTLAEGGGLGPLDPSQRAQQEHVRRWLLRLLGSERLPAVERALAGNALAALGDPRFDPARWQLPNEPLLGFVEVPPGPFLMGERQQQHTLDLPTFWIGRYPVTVAQWRAFVEASGYRVEDPDSLAGPDNHPVTSVNWHDALAYCGWLNNQLRAEAAERLRRGTTEGAVFWRGLHEGTLRVTLPSEAEWEKGARGLDGREYPWGAEIAPDLANYDDTGLGTTSVVGIFPDGVSPYGVLDMSGNVWEWTRSAWGTELRKADFGYPYRADDGREDLTLHNYSRVVRGGSFADVGRAARCACRYDYHPQVRSRHRGFRVAVSPPLASDPSGL